MIYQCYFRKEQQTTLFSHEPYSGFGLEPDLNEALLATCPELSDPTTRVALCEYAAFLYWWRHLEDDGDDWIGFTSYRQRDKSDVVFESKESVERQLRDVDMLAWHGCSVDNVRSRRLRGAAAQAELGHGMHQFTLDMLRPYGVTLPDAYQSAQIAPYASYWILRKNRFAQFMEWSWPIVQQALKASHPYKDAPDRGRYDDRRKRVGYFAERLFVIWSLREGLKITWLGRIAPMKFRLKRSWRELVFWWRYSDLY